jgi:hypothetical protein
MFDSENTFWFSQLLLNYIDKDYQTDGQLRLSLSTNTKDYVSFNPVSLSLSITDTVQNRSKSTILNIQNATDLFNSLKQLPLTAPVQVLKRYNKGQDLVFDLLKDVRTQETIMRLTIRNSDSDFTKVMININVLNVLIHRLKDFIEKYTLYCISLPNNCLLAELTSFIKGSILSMKEKSFIPQFPPFNISNPTCNEEIKKTETTISDLDKFIGGSEMTNINIPDLKEIETKSVEIKNIIPVESIFVTKFLNNNLSVLENELNNCQLQKNGLDYFINRLQPLYDMKLLDIEEKEYKSLIYTIHTLIHTFIRSYVEKGLPFPPSIPILKCHFKTMNPQNLELACDLLVFNAYIRAYRKRLESSINDSLMNGSLFYILFRCYTDVFCFSILDKQDPNLISTMVLNHFRFYKSKNVFDIYDKKLEEYGAQLITENDIVGFIEELSSKVLNKSPYLLQLHDTLFTNGSLKLANNIDFSVEQIIKEIVPLEVASKLGYDITTLEFYKDISKEVKILFSTTSKKQKPKEKKEEVEVMNNLLRLAKPYNQDVPESYRELFFQVLEEMGIKNTKFDFNDARFPLQEFGENIIKILYLWDPVTDPKIASNYKHFFSKFENEIMTKDLILSQTKMIKKVEEQTSGWTNFFDDIKVD